MMRRTMTISVAAMNEKYYKRQRDEAVRPAANPGARDLALTVLLQIPDGVVDPAPQHRARDRTAAKNRAQDPR